MSTYPGGATSLWVKVLGVGFASVGVLIALPPIVAAIAIVNSVTATDTTSNTIALAEGGSVFINAQDNVVVVAGAAGQVTIDERIEVRAPTRPLAGRALQQVRRTTLASQAAGAAVEVPAGSGVHVVSASRSVTIRVPARAPVQVVGLGSNIRLIGLAGSLDVQTLSGFVQLQNESVRAAVRVQATDAGIDFQGSLDGGQLTLDTGGGVITLHLPLNTAARLDAATSSGDLSIDPVFRVAVENVLLSPGRRAVGAINGGGSSTITLRSSSGFISISTG